MLKRLRQLRRLWLLALASFVAVWLFPISNFWTRMGGVVLLSLIWSGMIALCWRWRTIRICLLSLTSFVVAFLMLPARSLPSVDLLRGDYIAGLCRYEDVTYVWGGESRTGIDCSGLIRRGLVDSLFLRGVRSSDAGLVRRSLSLWWHDCSARDLGEQRNDLTVHLLDTPSINQLDHSQILPGDLAVTRNGVHVMAYLGHSRWIEADPTAKRVITVPVPANDSPWFSTPMRIVRWQMLQSDGDASKPE